jgi:hypothetical protein
MDILFARKVIPLASTSEQGIEAVELTTLLIYSQLSILQLIARSTYTVQNEYYVCYAYCLATGKLNNRNRVFKDL